MEAPCDSAGTQDNGDVSTVSVLPSTMDHPGTSADSQVSSTEADMRTAAAVIDGLAGEKGRPKLGVSKDHLQDLIEMDLSVSCISRLLGVSVKTVRRRMQQWGFSIKESYSKMTDKELDGLVSTIKADSPHLGHRIVKGRLKALGHRVQWTRVWESVHRVDSLRIHEKITNPGSILKRTHSVPDPLSLLHVDTNHKLIRYGVVMFGAIDGYSKKILYLKAANDNKASTALKFFLEAADKYGFPSRVNGNPGGENMAIARHMFEVRGRGRGSFNSGTSFHNQRIEHLWCDVWNVVSGVYYDLLHSLEEDGLLDPDNCTHLFCAQYVFLPRIQEDLDTFTDGWNNHALRTERNLSPNQLWENGKIHCPVSPLENLEGVNFPDMDITDTDESGVQVPELASPLTIEELEGLHEHFNPTASSLCFGADIYCAVVHYIEGILESRQEA